MEALHLASTCAVLVTCAGLFIGCEDDAASADAATLTLAGEAELFPGLESSTGLIPAGSPVQASFTVSAKGAAKLSTTVVATGSEDAPVLVAQPGTGALEIQAGFALLGQLKIAIDGLPSYDGPIPGIENVEIPILGSSQFEPFGIGKPVGARADIPPADLPGIPLPGGIPGQLVVAVAEGSFVELTFNASCAGTEGKTARLTGNLDRGGALVLRPRIEIEIPFLDTQTFDIPEFTVDLALGSTELSASAEVSAFTDEAPAGEEVEGKCGAAKDGGGTGGAPPDGSGGGGGTTETSTVSTGTGGACGSDSDCVAPSTCSGGVCS